MMKIVASLIVLGLFTSVYATGTVAPVSSSQASAFSGLNSTSTKVYSTSNSTDAANWDSTVLLATAGTVPTGVPENNVYFGPGMTNDTSYVYGIMQNTAGTQISKIIKRTVNNTVVGWSNDTVEASVQVADSAIGATIVASGFVAGVGPGYLAILSEGSDGTNNQVYYTLVSGTTASPVKVTSTLDIVTATGTTTTACTATTYMVNSIWYDIGSGAFFYVYTKRVNTYALVVMGTGCGSSSSGNSVVNTIVLGGVYANGTVYLAPLSLATTTPANTPSSVVAGGDNWLNSSNIYVVYKDSAKLTGGSNSATGVTYYAKITKSMSATASSFTSLVSDTITGTISVSGMTYSSTTPVVWNTFTPLSVWSSNFTYGIAVSNETYTETMAEYNTAAVATQAGTGTPVYAITNYLNSTLTATDSGITYSSATGVLAVYGWQLATGYTLVAQWDTATTNAFTWGTFYGNGTVNMTSTTLGSANGPVSFYEDVNGTMWIGWTDYDTSANSPTLTYAGYLAKLQGQLNVASSANVLSALSAFFALFLAAIFVF